ncbi:MAG: class C sortase [Lachnospiraceae bacterium]|nr:class C sortase [Lachnospiraceae bacterium]MDE7446987.1 class C sortase [Lachnospiraceae bacterium]
MDKKRAWFIAILFLSGLCITLYPFVSNLIAQSNASRAIAEYDEQIAQMDQEDIDAAKEAAAKYNEQLSNAVTLSSQTDESISYLDLIDVGESIGFIDIPKIDVYLPIYNGTSDTVLQKGVGHLEQSSYPIGGESTHSVLTGHRGLPSAVLFTDLDKMEVGDLFYLHVLDEILAYRVDQVKIVLPEEIDELKIVPGEDYCTLVTCHPYAINTHRMLVRGTRTDYIPEEEEEQHVTYSELQSGTLTKRIVDVWPWLLVSLVVMAIVETGIFLLIVKRKKQKKDPEEKQQKVKKKREKKERPERKSRRKDKDS